MMNTATVTAFPRRSPPNILVVEDDVVIRCLISDELRARGFKVLEANSADEAITILDKVNVDLLFVDIHLPGLRDGLDVARLVRARGGPTPIILTSGKTEASAIPDLDELGSFIGKPYLVSKAIDLMARSLNWPDGPRM